MTFIEILNQAFQILVPAAIILGTTYLAIFLNAKKNQIKENTDSEIAHKYLDMLEDTILKNVIATTQTYVQSLKDKNAFDEEAQKEAFKKTYDAVVISLTDEAKKYLNTIIGDLGTYITTRIEYNVKVTKGV